MKKKLVIFFAGAMLVSLIGRNIAQPESNDTEFRLSDLIQINVANAEDNNTNPLNCSWFGGTGCHADNWGKQCGKGLVVDPNCDN